MTAQVSVPQLPLAGSMRIEEGFEVPMRVAELETEDLQGQSKNCIQHLLKGNTGLKEKTSRLQESHIAPHQSNPATTSKVIDLRQSHTPKAVVEEPVTKVSGSFQDEVKGFHGGTKAAKTKGKPSDPINLPRYSRGHDPAPWVKGTFMDQPASSRQKIVDTHKRAYEGKYESYLRKKKSKACPATSSSKVVLVDSENIQLVKQCFSEMDRGKTGLVEKRVIMRYFHDNRAFASLFDLEYLSDIDFYMDRLDDVLGNIGAQEDALVLEEFLSFYQISKNNKEPSISVISEQDSVNVSLKAGPGVLPIGILQLIREAFEEVNGNERPVVDSEEFLQRLRMDVDIQANLDTPAVTLEGHILTLSQVLDQLLQDSASTRLLSWTDISNHFYITDPRPKPSDLDYIELPNEQVALLREVFLSVAGDEGTVAAAALTQAIREIPVFLDLLPTKAREPRGVSQFPEETFAQVLDRIEESGTDSLSWEEFISYFTTRGHPGGANDYESDPERYHSESPVLLRPPIARSVSNSPTPLGERYAITVPKPFSFTTRERSKKKPIRQVKLEEMLAAKERKEMEPCLVRIHASPVPAEVIIPRYAEIMRHNEERRRQVKEASIEMTHHNEKPFSFYFRDMNIKKPVADFYPEPFVFKANPVPWESTVPLLERMTTEGEELRKIRIEARAKQLYAQSKLPLRMQLHQPEATKKPAGTRSHSAYTIRSKPVPDFATLQAGFQRELESRKQNFKSTVPQPFHFNESRKTAQYREYMDNADAPQQWSGPQPTDLSKVFKRPAKEPASTEKHKALVELRKKEQQKREAERVAREQEEAVRAERRERMKPLVQQSEVIVDNSKAMSERREQALKEARRQEKDKDRQFKIYMAEMMERVYARPLMVEQVAEDARRKAGKIRALLEQRNQGSEEGMDSDMPFSEEEQPYMNERRVR